MGYRIALFARGDNFWYVCKDCLWVWTVNHADKNPRCSECYIAADSMEDRREVNERRLERMDIKLKDL